MKITINIELEPHELSTTSGCQVSFEAHRKPQASRHKHGVVDEAQLAGDALNGLVKDARSWIDARKRGAR